MKTLIFANTVPCRYSAYEVLLEEIHLAARQNGDIVMPVLGGTPSEDAAEKWRAAGMQWDVAAGWTDRAGREHPWVFPVRARDLIRQYKPNVAAVHFGNELPAIAAKLLCGGKISWVWEQDQQIKEPSVISSKLSRIGLLGAFFDHIVAMYEGGKQSMLCRGIQKAKCSVILNSIRDYAGPPANIRSELGLSEKSILLFSTSSLIARKRVDFVINAVARISAEADKDIHLIVAGEGEGRKCLNVLAERKRVSSRLHLIGTRKDVRGILSSIDIYVQSSLAEAAAYSIVEAMCAGKPVVMTNAGAAKEQVEDGVSGYVLDQDDLDGFVDRLVELINDPEKLQRMGEAGRERWSKMFRVEDAARKYVDLYRRLAISREQ